MKPLFRLNLDIYIRLHSSLVVDIFKFEDRNLKYFADGWIYLLAIFFVSQALYETKICPFRWDVRWFIEDSSNQHHSRPPTRIAKHMYALTYFVRMCQRARPSSIWRRQGFSSHVQVHLEDACCGWCGLRHVLFPRTSVRVWIQRTSGPLQNKMNSPGGSNCV